MDLIVILSTLTLLSNIFLILFLLAYASKKYLKKSFLYHQITKFVFGKELKYAFMISAIATLGSLYLSEVRKFVPCLLCWYQRVFMYPLPLILGTSLYKRLKETFLYVSPLSFIGAFIAFYHYLLQISPNELVPCSSVGFSVSCSERFFTYFGYITIPWMSFSAFVLVGLLMFLGKGRKKGV